MRTSRSSDDNQPVADDRGQAGASPGTGTTALLVTVPAMVLAGVSVVGVVVLAVLLWRLLHVVLLVVTAIILAEGVRGLVDLLHRRRVPFALSMAAAYGAIVIGVLGLMALLAGPTVSELSSLRGYVPAIDANVNRVL